MTQQCTDSRWERLQDLEGVAVVEGDVRVLQVDGHSRNSCARAEQLGEHVRIVDLEVFAEEDCDVGFGDLASGAGEPGFGAAPLCGRGFPSPRPPTLRRRSRSMYSIVF